MPSLPLDTLHRPIRDLRISVTDKCNFRCPYCMPAEIFGEKYEFLPKTDILTFEEITRLSKIFAKLGATKIRITGGEPLLRRDLETLIAKLSQIQEVEDLTLTTNGYLLADKAQTLKDAGLHRLTVSLDAIDDDTFNNMSGRDHGAERVIEGIRAAEKAGFYPLKINAVVQKGINDHLVVDLAQHFHNTGHILRFIEFMDVGNRNNWNMDQVLPATKLIDRIHAILPLEPLNANYTGEVAKRYRYTDGGGEIGVIASVTQPFCGDCTRIRLATDGKLYTCLFASEGTDLRDQMRNGASDTELSNQITQVWTHRTDRYSEIRFDHTPEAKKVEMYQIGG
ncbi:MAG: GTP 3',8-cyclase MoaA [Candidatus Latescibacteria bacterium]|nr:GTP 3',8-cyclase MoaA [Candidatus Latescibacterota bacterium]